MADYFIDITNDLCPITFVKTKLMIEKIAAGDRREVRLKGAEPLNNVPQSLRRRGHLLLSVTIESPACDENIHRLLIEKK